MTKGPKISKKLLSTCLKNKVYVYLYKKYKKKLTAKSKMNQLSLKKHLNVYTYLRKGCEK